MTVSTGFTGGTLILLSRRKPSAFRGLLGAFPLLELTRLTFDAAADEFPLMEVLGPWPPDRLDR